MKISVAVMAHPKRRDVAESLYDRLWRMGFSSCVIVWDTQNDEWSTGAATLRAHGESDYHVVLQDDAIVGDHFYSNVEAALSNVPERSLVSFYTGRVRPNREAVADAVLRAGTQRANWIMGATLFWGVAIAVPTEDIAGIISEPQTQKLKYDRRIGEYYLRSNRPVFYTNPSLADHDYRLGSLIGNDYARTPRVAYRYSAMLLDQWNQRTVYLRVRVNTHQG